MGINKKGSITIMEYSSFDPQKTDVDEHIDLINTQGDMLGQTVESKMEKFIDTMPTIIQTHVITCKTWAKTTKKANELEHIIRRCDPPAAALPNLTKGTAVPGLYSHIAHSNDKEETDIPQPFKGADQSNLRLEAEEKANSLNKSQNPFQYRYKRTNTLMMVLIITITMRIIEVNPEAVDLSNHGLYHNPHRNYQQGNNYGQFRGRSHGHGRGNYHRCSCNRSDYRGNNNYQYHQYYDHDDEYQMDQ